MTILEQFENVEKEVKKLKEMIAPDFIEDQEFQEGEEREPESDMSGATEGER